MAQQTINFSPAFSPTDDTLPVGAAKINANFDELYALQSRTLSAADPRFVGATNEASIDNAINLPGIGAVAVGAQRVAIPASMTPHDATLIHYAPGVQMVWEGGNWASYDFRAYGAPNDGTGNASPGVQAALYAAKASGGGVCTGSGRFLLATGIVVPNRVRILGQSEGSTVGAVSGLTFAAAASFNGAYLISNETAGQEFFWMEKVQLNCNRSAGALVGAGLLLTGVFVNSSLRDVVIEDASGNGLHATNLVGGGNFIGPVVLDNCWIIGCGDHNILIEGDHFDWWLSNVTSENVDAGKSLLRIDDTGSVKTSQGHHISNFHGEMTHAGCTGIDLVNTTGVQIDAPTFYLNGNATGATLVKIATANDGFQLHSLTGFIDAGGSTTLLSDAVSGYSKTVTGPTQAKLSHYQQGGGIFADSTGLMGYGSVGNVARWQLNGVRMKLLGANNFNAAGEIPALWDSVLALTWAVMPTQPNNNLYDYFTLTATSDIAATIPAPATMPSAGLTQLITFECFNNSGAGLSTPIAFATGAGAYLTSGGVSPANGQTILVTFRANQARSRWIEVARGAAV